MSLVILTLVTFFLHLVWERSHIHLYRDYEQLKGVLPVSVWASIGDVGYTFFAVFLVALFKGDLWWFQTVITSDYLGLAVLGFCTALFVEYKAFHFKRWAYTEAMPVVPLFKVGVSSLFQKSLLFPISIWLTTSLHQYFISNSV